MKYGVFYKSIWQSIKGSLGRFIAIMAIIALGVGFFAGVKVTKASMVDTADRYVREYDMYDFRLVSTLGFTEDEVKDIGKTAGVKDAEGSHTVDFFSLDRKGNAVIYKAHSITEQINRPDLREGRMPVAANECLGDMKYFTPEDLGSYIVVSSENDSDTKDSLNCRKFRLVGLVDSPLYMNKTERGTASIGDGSVAAFVLLPEAAFNLEYYTEAYVTAREQGYIYSDEYNKNIKKVQPAVESAAKNCGQDRYDDILSEANEKIAEGERELERGKTQLQNGKLTLKDKKKETYARLKNAETELDKNLASLQQAEMQLPIQKQQLANQIASLEAAKTQAEEAYQQALDMSDEDPAKEAAVAQALENLKAVSANLQQAKAGLAQINEAIAAIPQQKEQIQQGYRKIKAGKDKADREFARADRKLQDAEAELLQGERELDKARRDLADLKKPKLYTQIRDDNLGYDSFNSNSDIVNSIAKVFPIFFFLIAALVCSTTMSRMVEEERTQIGAFRAIGYSRRKILAKYLIYSGSAAVIGCISGFFLGSKFFPEAIWTGYNMMFDFSSLNYYFDLPLAIISLLVAVLCSVGTTYLACRQQLKEMPAEILRPKAPKAGKRVFLERISPLWNRMKFLHKVAVRNIFRYKKRMVMMILGIAGCTALVLAGFGIYDSVAGLADHQYEEIEKYDVTVQFDGELDKKAVSDFEKEVDASSSDGNAGINVMLPLERTSVTAKSPQKLRSCDLMITDEPEKLQKIVNFREGTTKGPKLSYPGKGEALINNKLAELMGVDEGDMITVLYDDTREVELKVSGIYRNYVGNYIYINAESYDSIMNKRYSPELAFIQFTEGDPQKLIENINGSERVLGIKLNSDTRKNVDKMMLSLNYIIWLVIACAGALAFIVLFNLGNINITERTREIATIKVLGFRPKETGAYVFRESIVLIIMGIIVGLPTGYILHKFIMTQIIVDMVAFNDMVEPLSYLYTVLMVFAFSLFTDLILRRKLKKINMAEALKSIE